MKLINLTKHPIDIFVGDGIQRTIEPSGIVARCASATVRTGEVIYGIPVTATQFGEVVGLPAPEEGTFYIVSSLTAQGCRGRKDVLIPNELVRDEMGHIIGCKSLGRI